jgi:predicted nucleotidyltransferase
MCQTDAMVRAMELDLADDSVLTRFRAALDALYGRRLERAVLSGSRARGDARPESDYNVAVFLRDYHGFWNEVRSLSAATTDILLDTGAVISAKPFPAGGYRERIAFMGEVRSDGFDL